MLVHAPLPAAAHIDLVRAQPAGNETIAPGLTHLRLTFSAVSDPAHSTITVYTMQHQPLDTGTPTLASDDRTALLVPLPHMPAGIYTVVWATTTMQEGQEHDTASGSFAFAVNAAPDAPDTSAIIQQPQPHFTLAPFERALPKWLAFVGIMALVGALSLRVLVWLPALTARVDSGNADADADAASSVDRRLLLFAAGALVLFIPATLTQFVWEVANASKHGFLASLDAGVLRSYLASPGSGTLVY